MNGWYISRPERKKINFMKSIVIYYSRTGNTQVVAETIANKFGADILPLRDKKNRNGIWNYFWAGFDALTQKKTKLEEINLDLNKFDLIFIGSPNWASTLPPAIRTFLQQHYWENKKIVFFCTQDGMGAERVFTSLRLATKGADIISEKFFNKVQKNKDAVRLQIYEWLEKINHSLHN